MIKSTGPRFSLWKLFLDLALVIILTLVNIPPGLANSADFVRSLWPLAQQRGISRSVFDAAFSSYSFRSNIIELTRKQPEFNSTVQTYIDRRVTTAQVTRGQVLRQEWRQTLTTAQQRWGVQPEIVLAIWGMETNFGRFMGGENTIHALATLTEGGYRSDYFRDELLTALQILSDAHVQPTNMVGSWAGAMGHTQFMPSSFMRYAVDFNGDGRKDIWNSVPDALGSTANYLKSFGWRPGETWGYEVKLPQGFNFAQGWQMGRSPLSQWQAMGVQRVSGRPFPRPDDIGRLYMPAGSRGPVFLLLPNFDVIKRYNNSDSYALAVGHLADRILGGSSFSTSWPNEDYALSREQKVEVQVLLSRAGHNVGTADGIIGSKTRAAVIAWQEQAGWPADGYVSARLLDALR